MGRIHFLLRQYDHKVYLTLIRNRISALPRSKALKVKTPESKDPEVFLQEGFLMLPDILREQVLDFAFGEKQAKSTKPRSRLSPRK